MNVFEFNDYRKYLQENIEQNQLVRGYRARLAEAAGCQKSFFSQVLNSSAELSSDHAANLSQFWQFNFEETSYFVDLVLLVRTGSPAFREVIRERLRAAREKHINLEARFAWPKIERSEQEALYFSSWYWSAIHVITAIPQWRTTSSIARRLNLSVKLVEDILQQLNHMGMVKEHKKEWQITEKLLHLPQSSFMTEMNHLNWRQRAMNNIQLQDASAIHYSLVFALSAEDFSRLREILVNQIQSFHKIIGPSVSEEIACFTCDLFRL
jgi:uncharacterized protein (TIGR02147 family)